MAYHFDKVNISAALNQVAIGTALRWAKTEVGTMHSEGHKQQASRLQNHVDVAEVAIKMADKKLGATMKKDEWRTSCQSIMGYQVHGRFPIPLSFQERCFSKHMGVRWQVRRRHHEGGHEDHRPVAMRSE